MNALNRVLSVAFAELAVALRSRRALVVLLLFSAVSAFVMYSTVGFFSVLETELVKLLGLPETGETGAVTLTLWKSEKFMRIMSQLTRNAAVYSDIIGRHPIVLAYAFFAFAVTPLVTLMASAPSVASDVGSGSVRYMLTRVTRTEWSIGKFLGEALMTLCAMTASAVVAWVVAVWRLPGFTGGGLLPGLIDWTLRAWVLSFAYLGLFMGVSHLVRSPGKATALAIVALVLVVLACHLIRRYTAETGPLAYLDRLDVLFPDTSRLLLWRRDPSVFIRGVVHLVTLGFLYLSLGAAFFARRDV